jgi:hypothetical protein
LVAKDLGAYRSLELTSFCKYAPRREARAAEAPPLDAEIVIGSDAMIGSLVKARDA